MAGDVINLTYYENSDAASSAPSAARGRAAIAWPARRAGAGAASRGEFEIGVAPDGSTVTSLNGRDSVRWICRHEGQPSKSVALERGSSTGARRGTGLTAARSPKRSSTARPAARPRSSARCLARRSTALNGGLGGYREARFVGSVRLRDERGAARRPRHARTTVDRGQSSSTGTGKAAPRVVNEQIASMRRQSR